MHKFSLSKQKTFFFCTIFFSSFTYAQQPGPFQETEKRIMSDSKVESVVLSKERETPLLISMKTGNSYPRAQAAVTLENFLNTRAGIDFLKIDKQSKLQDDIEVVEFQQYYKGIKVDRAKYKALVKSDFVRFYNGAFYKIPANLTIQPKLTMDVALQYARSSVNATKFATDEFAEYISKTTDAGLKLALQKELADAAPKGELVLVQDFTNKEKTEVKLAYKFNIYASQPLSRAWVYVDAMTGKILLTDAIIKHFDKTPPPPASVLTAVQTRYAGLRNIYVKQVSGNDPNNGTTLMSSHPTTETYIPGALTWVLADDTRGNGVETYDLNGIGGLPVSAPPAYTAAKSFTDVDNNWTLAEHKRGTENGPGEAENDDIAWDAQWGAEIVYDYWKNKHNRLSYDGLNTSIRSFIHSGSAYDNAFWNGTVMTYGDGSGTAAGGFKPLVSLDVCGHEIGHGVCSSTSDLVYAGESGAMNEALSDIWAACIEFYAIKKVDSSLKNVYKPFSIGEQISADPAAPLRRMDNPKSAQNPDTYGGQYWTAQDGCTATLANDECGVHNNSGVLNKWFYLITVGSGAGSGPDMAYAGTDDGVNDAVATGSGTHPANPYTVTGLGFDVAEDLTFLTETMLSSAATYAEAREVSIAVATQMSGNPCSAEVETVTNAWYAVGVGGKFVKPCSVTYGFVSNINSATTEAATPAGCNSSKSFKIPVIMPAGSSATVTYSGTATKGADYTVPTGPLTNSSASTQKKILELTIRNDGYVEPTETIIINIAVTNTGGNPVNSTFTLTLLDDDVVPVIGSGTKTLRSETFTRADGFADPAGWTEMLEVPEAPNGDPAGSGKNQWGIFSNALAITGKDGTTGTTFPSRTYNSNSASQTIIKSPIIDARGLSVVNIAFDFTVQGEVDPSGTDPENFPAFDYMAVAYSFDGNDFTELNTDEFRQFAAASPTSGSINAALPAALANKQFYLGFRWKNDANAGGPTSVSIDNLILSGAARTLENDLNDNGSEIVGSGKEVYFYSSRDEEILGKIKNNSPQSLGCTNLSIEKAGTGTFNLFLGGNGFHKVSDKVLRISGGSARKLYNKLTLFISEAQLQSLETATGRNRSDFNVYQIDAPNVGSATSTNTRKFSNSNLAYSPLTGSGATYTITNRENLTGSYAIGIVVPAVPRSAEPFVKVSDNETSDWKFENIYPNPGRYNAQYAVTAPVQQKVRIDIVSISGQLLKTQSQTLPKGYTNLQLPVSQLAEGNYLIYIKDEKGHVLNIQKYIKQ